MANQASAGWHRLRNASRYSWSGLLAAWHNEQAFRQECYLCLVFLPLALWLGSSGLEKALLIASLLLIMIVELINSAIEAVVDRIGIEHHELSKRAKDIGSAAVLLALLNAAVIWLLILFV